MGILARAVAERKASDPLALWAEMLRAGTSSKAGPSVNLESALKVGVAFACMRKLAQGVAQVPFKLYRKTEKDGRPYIAPEHQHSLYDLLATAPNDWTTAYEFRETQMLHAALGNSYAFKNMSTSGKVLELILLNPGMVKKRQLDNWQVVYTVTGKSGATQDFPAEAIWHVRGPSWDGVLGLNILNLAREALGLAIATEESHAKLHAKGVRPSGIYTVEGNLNEKQYKDLKAWIEKEGAGAENAGSVLLLDRGATFATTAMTGVDAQHIETRGLQIQEVCRFFDIMPIMVGYSDKAATYASAEQMFLAHVVHTLSPWYTRIENSADLYLLTKKERAAGLYTKHQAAALLRGASKDRADYFAKALGTGGGPAWMCQDEVRGLEELNPMGGAAAVLPIATNKPAAPPSPPNED